MNNPNYNYTNNFVEINIHKPLYGTYVYIRNKHLDYAMKHEIPLKVTIPEGTYIVSDVFEWIRTGQRQEKVFLIPDKPMVLWGNHLSKMGEKVD